MFIQDYSIVLCKYLLSIRYFLIYLSRNYVGLHPKHKKFLSAKNVIVYDVMPFQYYCVMVQSVAHETIIHSKNVEIRL